MPWFFGRRPAGRRGARLRVGDAPTPDPWSAGFEPNPVVAEPKTGDSRPAPARFSTAQEQIAAYRHAADWDGLQVPGGGLSDADGERM